MTTSFTIDDLTHEMESTEAKNLAEYRELIFQLARKEGTRESVSRMQQLARDLQITLADAKRDQAAVEEYFRQQAIIDRQPPIGPLNEAVEAASNHERHVREVENPERMKAAINRSRKAESQRYSRQHTIEIARRDQNKAKAMAPRAFPGG